MERSVKGDVVVVPFPFSDLSAIKRRPALVLSALAGNDLILCEITSREISDSYAVRLTQKDFSSDSLNRPSIIRPNKLFCADQSIVLYRAGKITKEKLAETVEKACRLIRE